jgi:hypothetical protein
MQLFAYFSMNCLRWKKEVVGKSSFYSHFLASFIKKFIEKNKIRLRQWSSFYLLQFFILLLFLFSLWRHFKIIIMKIRKEKIVQETIQRQKRLAKAHFFLHLHFLFSSCWEMKRYFAILAFWITFIVLLRVKKKKMKISSCDYEWCCIIFFFKLCFFLRSGKQWNFFLFSSSSTSFVAACRAHAIYVYEK